MSKQIKDHYVSTMTVDRIVTCLGQCSFLPSFRECQTVEYWPKSSSEIFVVHHRVIYNILCVDGC
uniref:Uncharacterized protein n=1 Tax=Lepeophtheirus salmonis TaxID=72036 RepID=A0A0K2US44_LEPSM